MAQPFVISMRIDGDARSAVAATHETSRAIEEFSNDVDTARLKAMSLSTTLVEGERQRALTARNVIAFPGADVGLVGRGGSQAVNTANVAAQFQDIAVTSAMGMSPLQIALQQGTQLASVLGNQGAAGAAKTLGAALFSVISPVSLLTIGAVALGAAGIQAMTGFGNSSKDAADALKEHDAWLETILTGYDAARRAAKGVADEAAKLPKAALQSELSTKQDTALDAYKSKLIEISTLQDTIKKDQRNLELRPEEFADLIPLYQQLTDLRVGVNSTETEFGALIDRLTIMKNGDYPAYVKHTAERILDLAQSARASKSEVDGLGASLSVMAGISLPDWTKSIGGLQGVSAAMAAIKDRTPDLRTTRQKNLDDYSQNIGQARTYSEAIALTQAYNDAEKALDQQDAQNSAKKSSRSAKALSEYDQAIQAIQGRTAAQELETNVLGLSAFAAERARQQLELENAAKKDAIGLSPSRIEQINQEASAYAQTQAAYEKATEAEQARDEARQFAQGNFRSLFVELGGLSADGALGWDDYATAGTNALDRIRDRALGMAADGIFDMIFGAVTGAVTGGTGGGGGLGGLISGIFGIGKNAKGTDNWRGGLTRIHEEGGEIVDLPSGTRIIPHDVSMAMAANSQRGDNSVGNSGGNTYNTYNIDAKGSNISRAEFIQILDQRDRSNAAKAPDLLYDARYRGNSKVGG